MNDDQPRDPNQVLCACGRLIRVVPALVCAAFVIADCTFTGGERCERCRASWPADGVED